MSTRVESALKGKGLEIILIKTRGLRGGIEKLTEYYVTTLRLELNYKGGDYETIYLEDRLLSIEDFATTRKYYNKIKVLERLISAFITLYRRANILYYNSSIKILK
jgi:hypothetical protein